MLLNLENAKKNTYLARCVTLLTFYNICHYIYILYWWLFPVRRRTCKSRWGRWSWSCRVPAVQSSPRTLHRPAWGTDQLPCYTREPGPPL